MCSNRSRCPEALFEGSGVVRFAVADLAPVDSEADSLYRQWIAAGCHGDMSYLERYADIRRDPHLLLEGARSIICCAIPYPNPLHLPPAKANIASYALGTDYHEVVRRNLSAVADRLRETVGGETRVCVDTAPLRERYWAVRSGLGITGLNGHLIVPGLGSCFFLGEILTTALLCPTDANMPSDCGRCGRCVRACPAGAIRPDGSVDARRCLSYLTIEYHGDFPAGTDLRSRLYGCDICAAVCPHNTSAPLLPLLPELEPRPALLQLTVEEAAEMTQEQFSAIFRRSAVKRTKVSGLRRNALSILKSKKNE